MIGQKDLLDIINKQIEDATFPRFSIIIGQEGSGKRTLAKAIAMALECNIVFIEPKVDAVREMIKECYSVTEPMVYCIADTDTMSVSAKNALLKICEEPPKNAYIIMTADSNTNVLSTLWSRAGRYFMQPYTPQDLIDYAETACSEPMNVGIMLDLCETPGDVNTLESVGAEEFYEFVEKVVDNVAETSAANAFKIANSINFKGTEGYDMALFLRAFRAICGTRLREATVKGNTEDLEHYSLGIKVVSKTLNQLQITGINKGALFDIFILDIRREWC